MGRLLFLKTKLLGGGEYVDEHAFRKFTRKGFHLAFFELDDAIDESEEGVISATFDIFTRVKLGTTLANENITFFGYLSTKDFDAETFGN